MLGISLDFPAFHAAAIAWRRSSSRVAGRSSPLGGVDPALLALQPLQALVRADVARTSLAYVKSAPRAALAPAQGSSPAAMAAGSVLGMPLWGALYRRAGNRSRSRSRRSYRSRRRASRFDVGASNEWHLRAAAGR
jgi:hypothetical protein